MNHIHVADGLRLRFPGQDESFDRGVEIGILAVLMDGGSREIVRWISTANLDQARALGERMGYRLVVGPTEELWTRVILRTGQAKPALRLVQSAG